MLKAIVIAHYNFENKKGQEINTSKLRISLNEFGYIELCSNLVNEYPIFSVLNCEIEYDEKRNKYKVTKVTKG